MTERGTNRITTFVLGDDGLASAPNVYASAGVAPFGFAFDQRGTLVVSNAGGDSGASSYAVAPDGAVTALTTLASGRRAACWIAIPKNGRYAYATNGGTADVTGFAIDQSGSLSLLDPSGVNGTTTGGATDSAFSESSRFLYVRTGAGTVEGSARTRTEASRSCRDRRSCLQAPSAWPRADPKRTRSAGQVPALR